MAINTLLRFDRAALVAELEKAGAEIRGSAVKCPFHDDKSASGSIHQDDAGVWRYTCHGGNCNVSGDIYDIKVLASGQTTAEVLKSSPAKTQVCSSANRGPVKVPKKVWTSLSELEAGLPRIEKRYDYADGGPADLIVYRCCGSDGKKTFRQVHPVTGGFVMEAPPKPWPLYERSVIREAEQVIVVEGEKCAQALLDLDYAATTSPCGAGKAAHADWSILAGKDVVLWPDNDEAGQKHMKEVEAILNGLNPPATVSWLNPLSLNLTGKQDAADYVAEYADGGRELQKQAVECALQEVRRVGPADELESLLESTIRGERSAISWPWTQLSKFTRALLPGTVTLICGDPGSSKSFFLLEAAAYWHDAECPIAVLELEEDRSYHLNRALAQRVKMSQLFDDEWVRTHGDLVREAFAEHREWLDGFGRRIFEAPDKQMTLEQIAAWVRGRCDAGCRIIAVDPVTAAVGTDKPWLDDLKFIMEVKTIARKYGASVILVTHPKKGRKQAVGMDELSGGSGYQRFAQTIVWIESHASPVTLEAYSPMGGTMDYTCNRTVRLIKARNGLGHGYTMAFQFNGGSLLFDEYGVVVPKGRSRKGGGSC